MARSWSPRRGRTAAGGGRVLRACGSGAPALTRLGQPGRRVAAPELDVGHGGQRGCSRSCSSDDRRPESREGFRLLESLQDRQHLLISSGLPQAVFLAAAGSVHRVERLRRDVRFERAVLERLLSQGSGNLAVVSRHQSWMSGTVVSVDARGRVQATIVAQNQEKGFDYSKVFKTANIYLFRQDFLKRYFLPQLEAYIASKDYDAMYASSVRFWSACSHKARATWPSW